jgi:hypothetical protein
VKDTQNLGQKLGFVNKNIYLWLQGIQGSKRNMGLIKKIVL